MANTASAKKMVRKIARRTAVNKARRSRYRTFVKRVEEAIEAGDGATAKTALSQAQTEIDRAVNKGILHRNTAARKVSRLTSRIKAVQAS